MLYRSVVVLVCLGACVVGEPPPGGGGGGDDTGGSPDARIPVSGVDADPNCVAAVVGGGGDGHHNAGIGCIAANCHGVPTGAGAPQYSIAGTLYESANGLGVDGATIIVTDANGTTVNLTTRGLAGPGNFLSTDLALTPPFTVRATQCPAFKQMGTPAATGNCNSCHSTGGQAGAKLHL